MGILSLTPLNLSLSLRLSLHDPHHTLTKTFHPSHISSVPLSLSLFVIINPSVFRHLLLSVVFVPNFIL